MLTNITLLHFFQHNLLMIRSDKYTNEVRTERAGSGASGSQSLNILTGFSPRMEAEHQRQTKQTASKTRKHFQLQRALFFVGSIYVIARRR